jgi:PAS domain-containing protein
MRSVLEHAGPAPLDAPESPPPVNDREDWIKVRTSELLADSEHAVACRTDRLLGWLMVVQWLAGIAAALWISPRTWAGTESWIHLHVWAAVFYGGLVSLFPLILVRFHPGRTVTRHVLALAQCLTSALLIHLTGGRIETHFHVFGSLAILAFYRDWRVLVTASTVVAADHFLRGVYWPQSVFGVLTASHWRWMEHAGWVVFEVVFLQISIFQSRREMTGIAERQARLEQLKESVELEVLKRTRDLEIEIVERRHAEDRLRRNSEMEHIENRVQAAMLEAPEGIYQAVLAVARELFECHHGCFGHVRETDGALVCPVATDAFRPPGQAAADTIELSRESWSMVAGDTPPARGSRFENGTFQPPHALEELKRSISGPIMLGDKLIGALQLAGRSRDFDANDIELMDRLCHVIAPVLKANRERELNELTRRKELEERQKLVALIEASSDFIGIVSLDGEALYQNPAGCRLVGLEGLEEVRGRHQSEFQPRDQVGLCLRISTFPGQNQSPTFVQYFILLFWRSTFNQRYFSLTFSP